MKRYEKYKNSGIRWIGQIPEHWHVGKIKFLCDAIYAGATPSTSNPAYWEGGTIPWIPSGCCHDCNINEAPKYITEEGLQHSSTKLIPANTTVMALTGATCALLGYLTFESCANQSVVAFVENKPKANSRYLYYTLFAARQEILSHQSGGAQGGVNQEDCSNIVIPFIALSEQEAIVRFLDDKSSKLDECVRLLELQKADLTDYRKAIISETVTRGLNPNAKLKDSGVDWIGQIPEEWKIDRLKNYYSFEKGKKAALYTSEYISEHYGVFPVYSGQTENDGIMGTIDSFDYDVEECLFTTTVGAKVMTPKILHGKFSLSQNCLIMQAFANNVVNHYVYYMLLKLFEHAKSQIPTYMQPSLRIEDLKKYICVIPPLSEQQAIADYLDTKTAKIDEAIERIDEQINDLRAYRTALISDVVTGKIDVRNN